MAVGDTAGFVAQKGPRTGMVGQTTNQGVAPTTSLTASLGQAMGPSATPRNDAFNSYQSTILPPLPNIGPTAPMSRRLA
jgi:hypothetical protein